MIQSAGVNNSVSKLLPFEANEGINHESGPYTFFGLEQKTGRFFARYFYSRTDFYNF